MPNFCAVNILLVSEYVRLNRQRAALNEEETNYIYKGIEEVLKKDNLRVVFVQSTEDTDIKKLAISRADTREEYMNWQTNATGDNVGFETIAEPEDAMLGNKVNSESDLIDALIELLIKMGVPAL